MNRRRNDTKSNFPRTTLSWRGKINPQQKLVNKKHRVKPTRHTIRSHRIVESRFQLQAPPCRAAARKTSAICGPLAIVFAQWKWHKGGESEKNVYMAKMAVVVRVCTRESTRRVCICGIREVSSTCWCVRKQWRAAGKVGFGNLLRSVYVFV